MTDMTTGGQLVIVSRWEVRFMVERETAMTNSLGPKWPGFMLSFYTQGKIVACQKNGIASNNINKQN